MAVDRCEMCQEAPAALVCSRRHFGLILYGRTREKQRLLCAQHGKSLLLNDLLFTLILGWWGVFSFLITLTLIPSQLLAISAHKKTLATLVANSPSPKPTPAADER